MLLEEACAFTWAGGKEKPVGPGKALSCAFLPFFPSTPASVGLREDAGGEGRPEWYPVLVSLGSGPPRQQERRV